MNYCSICLTDIPTGRSYLQTKCNHIFHAECLNNWLGQSPTCPYCRAPCSTIEFTLVYFDLAGNDSAAEEKRFSFAPHYRERERVERERERADQERRRADQERRRADRERERAERAERELVERQMQDEHARIAMEQQLATEFVVHDPESEWAERMRLLAIEEAEMAALGFPLP